MLLDGKEIVSWLAEEEVGEEELEVELEVELEEEELDVLDDHFI